MNQETTQTGLALASSIQSDYESVRRFVIDQSQRSFFYLHLEPTNACNTHCQMCPRDAMSRSYKMMSWPTFTRLMELVLPSDIPMISIVGFGEPLLHKNIGEMLRYIRLRRPDIIIKLTTNGSMLTESMISELYDSGLDLLEISFVGTDPTTYSRHMGSLSFERTLHSISRLQHQGRRFLITTFEIADESIAQIKAFWQKRGVCNVHIKGFHRRGGYLEPVQISRNTLGNYKRRTELSTLPSMPSGNGLEAESCHKLFMFIHVNAEGNFIPCVQEINNKNVLFNINEVQSYNEIVERMQSVRPEFNICNGCELKSQDLVDYYTNFLLKYFPVQAQKLAAI